MSIYNIKLKYSQDFFQVSYLDFFAETKIGKLFSRIYGHNL